MPGGGNLDIRNIQYQLRPRRLDEVFDFALLVIRRHLGLFLLVGLPPVILFTALNTVLIFYLNGGWLDEPESSSWLHLFVLVLLFFERSVLALPVLLLNGTLLFDDRPRLRQILRTSLSVYPRYLMHQAVLRSVLCVGLGWTIIAPWWAVVTHFFKSEVIALERLQGAQIGRRLSAMTAGQNERTFGFLIIDAAFFVLVVLAASYGWNYLLDTLKLAERYWWLDAQPMLLAPIMHVFILSYAIFHTTAKFLFYIDSRSLREGWDVELSLVKGIRETEEVA